jgi:uridine phosphorylase
VRIGTSGSLQKDLPVDSWVLSEKAIGFDGLLNFYAGRDRVSDLEFEDAFTSFVGWNRQLTAPYVVNAGTKLVDRLDGEGITKGVNISSPGFYGPQGRVLRLNLVDPELNNKITDFRFENYRITNYEMECSAIYGLSALMGHQAATVCAIIANRLAGTYSDDYKSVIKSLVETVLSRLFDD